MGYYTYYKLTIVDGDESLINELRKECEDASWAFDSDGYENEAVKWYEHETDMKEFSKKHPNVLFLLEREGEQNDDIWKCYFKNGKMQRCHVRMEFDDFDENKLV